MADLENHVKIILVDTVQAIIEVHEMVIERILKGVDKDSENANVTPVNIDEKEKPKTSVLIDNDIHNVPIDYVDY